jgi:hypothetical protein
MVMIRLFSGVRALPTGGGRTRSAQPETSGERAPGRPMTVRWHVPLTSLPVLVMINRTL